ncbi:MAG: hypothetical protein IH595_01900 [Bacteroidales bacterium]|nr:hypothetical protein [Bacteroidales bacterium]
MLISVKNKKQNLTIRKFAQVLFLILFLSPYAVKAFHFHSLDDLTLRNPLSQSTLTHYHAPCYICEYQLVHFVDKDPLPSSIHLPSVFITSPQVIDRLTSTVFYYYKHRGPPAII